MERQPPNQWLDIHTHRGTADTAIRAILNVSAYEAGEPGIGTDQWVSLGLHPWYFTAENVNAQLAVLESKAGHSRVKLIGECGFDRLRGPDMRLQHRAFRSQIDLALTYGKPLIIHCVKAFDELLPYGGEYASRLPMIVHGFNKSPQLARQLIRHGFFLSFGSAIGRERSNASHALQQIDAPFFLETDDSQADIRAIYERAAFLRNVTVDEMKDAIFASWKKIRLI